MEVWKRAKGKKEAGRETDYWVLLLSLLLLTTATAIAAAGKQTARRRERHASRLLSQIWRVWFRGIGGSESAKGFQGVGVGVGMCYSNQMAMWRLVVETRRWMKRR